MDVEKIEKFMAHTIPDLVNVAAAVVILIAAMNLLKIYLRNMTLLLEKGSLFVRRGGEAGIICCNGNFKKFSYTCFG